MSLGIMPFKLILGIFMMSVRKDRLVPSPKAPCPISTETFLLANFINIF